MSGTQVSLAEEKVEGPATSLTFLVVLDSMKMEMQLPEEKLLCIHHKLSGWLRRKKATKRDILNSKLHTLLKALTVELITFQEITCDHSSYNHRYPSYQFFSLIIVADSGLTRAT